MTNVERAQMLFTARHVPQSPCVADTTKNCTNTFCNAFIMFKYANQFAKTDNGHLGGGAVLFHSGNSTAAN